MGVISLLVEDEYQNFMHGRSGYLERRNANQRSYRKREASSLGGPPTKKSLTDDSNNDVQKLESTRATKVSAINLSGMQTKMIMGNFWPKHVYEVSERERERERKHALRYTRGGLQSAGTYLWGPAPPGTP